MNFAEYEAFVKESFTFKKKPTLAHPDKSVNDLENRVVVLLGIGGESGEVLDDLKKIFRENRQPSPEEIESLKLELGDVLWHIAAIAAMYGLSLEDVAKGNISKLQDKNQ